MGTDTFTASHDEAKRWQVTFLGSPGTAECAGLVARIVAGAPREIHAFGDPLPEEFLHALGRPKLPTLERLVLALGSEEPFEDDDIVVGLLSRLDAPKLRVVHIDALSDVCSVIDQLATYGQTRAWKELRLGGEIDDEQALLEIVETNRAALAGLDVLGLPLAQYLTPGGAAKLRALCPAVRDLGELPPITRPGMPEA